MQNYDNYYKHVVNVNLHKQKYKLNNHTVFYGPNGTGKYSQIIYAIYKKYKLEHLHEKKMIIEIPNKNNIQLKITSYFVELDFQSIQLSNKNTLFTILDNINDSYYLKQKKNFLIICKNFEHIERDCLEIFHSLLEEYTQFTFLFHTNSIGFIPDSILNQCTIHTFNGLSNIKLKKAFQKIQKKEYNIENLQEHKLQTYFSCDKINKEIVNLLTCDQIDYSKLRELLYSCLIYNISIYKTYLYVIKYFMDNELLSYDILKKHQNSIVTDFMHYNNNYRPIYHLEKIFLTIVSLSNELQ